MNDFYTWLRELLKANQLSFSEAAIGLIEIQELHCSLIFKKVGEKIAEGDGGYIIWEDWWQFKKKVIQSKVKSKLGLLFRLPARLCVLRRITKPEAYLFLKENHLQGSTGSKINYGLFLSEKYYRVLDFLPEKSELLVAVMTFSGARKFRDGSSSFELLRYAVLQNYAVTGGFTKLLSGFIKDKNPDSIMTYADLDWYSGNSYERFGFERSGDFAKSYYKLDAEGVRIKVASDEDYDVVNRGSIKMIWKKK